MNKCRVDEAKRFELRVEGASRAWVAEYARQLPPNASSGASGRNAAIAAREFLQWFDASFTAGGATVEADAWRAVMGWEHDESAFGSVVEKVVVAEHSPGFDRRWCLRCRVEAEIAKRTGAP